MRIFFIIIVTNYIFSFLLFSQTGKIEGRVFNEVNNEPLPFSSILISGTQTGTVSDFDGFFIITGVDPGFITLTVSSLGFESIVTQDIQVTNNKAANIEIALKEKTLSISEVQITASKFKKTEESPVSLRTLSASEIENSPGANRDISKVIQTLPGVAALPGPNRNDVIVRGGSSNESRYYLDDIEIPYINHFSTKGASGGTNGILNADFIREVEFYSGAFPSSRGNALSGVFNFKQIDGNSEKMKFRAGIGASETSFTVDGPIGDKTNYIFSVRRSYLQFLFKVIGLPFLPTFNDYQLKIRTKINDKSEIKLISIGALDQFILDTEIKNPSENQQYILNYLPVYGQWSYTIGGVYKQYRKKGFTNWIISRNMLNNRIYKYFNNDYSNDFNRQFDYISQEVENKFRYENILKTGDWNFSYGLSAENAKYTNETFRKVYTTFGLDTINYNSSLSFYKWGVFGQTAKRFYDNRLSFSVGIRMDGNSYSEYMTNMLRQISPRFSMSFNLTKKVSLNFNSGIYYQLPAYTVLGYRNNENVLINKLNGIKYISSDHLVAGIEYMPDNKTKIATEGFTKLYNDYPFSLNDSISIAHKMIDFGTLGDEPVISISKGRVYGIEFLIQSSIKKDVNFVLSYTYAVSEFKDINNHYRPTGWDNRHILITTVIKKFKNNWFAGIKWRYAGGLPYTPYDLDKSEYISAWDLKGQPYMNNSKLNSLRFKAFHQLDIRVDKIFYMKKASIKLYLDIQNFYNFKSESQDRITNLDENGIPVVDNVDPNKYVLRTIPDEGSGTILPTIGVIIDF
ncbi:MAG: TonB-dependent receptor [Bacteroidota bacterium]